MSKIEGVVPIGLVRGEAASSLSNSAQLKTCGFVNARKQAVCSMVVEAEDILLEKLTLFS